MQWILKGLVVVGGEGSEVYLSGEVDHEYSIYDKTLIYLKIPIYSS